MNYLLTPFKLLITLTLFFSSINLIIADNNKTNDIHPSVDANKKNGLLAWIPNPLKAKDDNSRDMASSNMIAQVSQGLTEIPDWLQNIHNNLEEYSSQLDNQHTIKSVDSLTVAEWLNGLKIAKLKAQQNIRSISTRLQNINTQLDSLGVHTADESPDVTKKRELLEQEKAALTSTDKYSQFIVIRITETEQRLQTLGKTHFKEKMLTRRPALWELLSPSTENQGHSFKNTISSLYESLQNISHGFIKHISILFILGFIIGLWVQYKIPRGKKDIEDTDTYSFYTNSIANNFRSKTPILLALIATNVIALIYPETINTFFHQLSFTLIIYIIIFSFLKALLCVSKTTSIINSWSPKQTKALYRLIHSSCTIFIGGYALYWLGLHEYLDSRQQHLLTSVILIILSINMIINLAWLLKVNNLKQITILANLTILTLGVTLFLEISGFHMLSFLILKVTLGIFVGGTIGMLLRTLSSKMLDQLEQGKLPGYKNIKQYLGIKDDKTIPGIIWVRILTAVLIWTTLLAVLIWFSGYSSSVYPFIRNAFFSGFSFGKITIIPLHIMWAVLSLITVLIVSRIIQSILTTQWLNKTHLNQGSSDAIIKIINYIGITIAIIIALSTMGVSLTNLAVIAGALSVGIGFGLQNIVNNFISGIILLFERPIRRGDWIVSGTTEGFVKSINIRATVIQTFDHADVIVPNAELISANVTNWVLSSNIGRVRIPISVAYGSDTNKVKEILQNVAEEHDNIFNKNYHKFSPTILFIGFGDSSLNFELRCFLRNIQDRLVTISDINFAIDAAFREANVEIPFPQQDIHIRKQTEEQSNKHETSLD